MAQKFLRRSWNKLSKLGKGRKKVQRWRKPTGRDNKMREKRKGYSPLVSIGYRSDKETRGTLRKMVPITVMNLSDLSKIQKGQIAYLGKVGKKKKISILEKAKEMKIEFHNVKIEKFLKTNKLKKKEIKK
ncbi:50S ribosomal protein L32e [archaeon]|jgi:large subunit ribosomal protein L32e|nr:50S ribosomal protein L32e [archaeon]